MDEATFISEKRKPYRGVPDTEFVWRGTQCDPAIDYKGYRINYYDIDDALWVDFTEAYPGHRLLSAAQTDTAFQRFVENNNSLVYDYMDSAIDAGAAEPAPDDTTFDEFVWMIHRIQTAKKTV